MPIRPTNRGRSEAPPQGLTASHSFNPQRRRRGKPEQYINELGLSYFVSQNNDSAGPRATCFLFYSTFRRESREESEEGRSDLSLPNWALLIHLFIPLLHHD